MRERFSRGEGRPIVFVHSGLGDGSQWEDFIALAPSGVCAVVLDLPELAYEAPGTTLIELESQFASYLERRFGEQLVMLVGVSLGGWLVARALSKSRARIERAVIVAGVVRLSRETAVAYETLASAVENGQLGLEQVFVDLATSAFGSAKTPELVERLNTGLRQYSPERFVRAVRLIGSLANDGTAVEPYAVPTHVVQSEGDSLVSPEASRALAALGSEARLELWPGDSHLLQLTEPERLAKLIFG